MGKCGDLDRATDLTPVGGGASCGMHESQSRLYGNMLGRELPVGKLLEQGNLAEITALLGGKIHHFGAVKPARQLCGQPFSAGAYLAYLRAKVEGLRGGLPRNPKPCYNGSGKNEFCGGTDRQWMC